MINPIIGEMGNNAVEVGNPNGGSGSIIDFYGSALK